MRQEWSPLDLNNLPEEECGKQQQAAVESSTTTAASTADAARLKKKKKKSGGGKDGDGDGDGDGGKVYECRFCSLKFGRSQALGGHMNRHRQERETETLNRARQLVFGNDTLISAVGAQMRFRDVGMGSTAPSAMLGGGFRGGGRGGGPCLPFRPRVSPPPYRYLYTTTTPSMVHPMSYPAATYPTTTGQPAAAAAAAAAVGEYAIGHAVSSGDALAQQQRHQPPPPCLGGFSCFGLPLRALANARPADNAGCSCSFMCGHSRTL